MTYFFNTFPITSSTHLGLTANLGAKDLRSSWEIQPKIRRAGLIPEEGDSSPGLDVYCEESESELDGLALDAHRLKDHFPNGVNHTNLFDYPKPYGTHPLREESNQDLFQGEVNLHPLWKDKIVQFRILSNPYPKKAGIGRHELKDFILRIEAAGLNNLEAAQQVHNVLVSLPSNIERYKFMACLIYATDLDDMTDFLDGFVYYHQKFKTISSFLHVLFHEFHNVYHNNGTAKGHLFELKCLLALDQLDFIEVMSVGMEMPNHYKTPHRGNKNLKFEKQEIDLHICVKHKESGEEFEFYVEAYSGLHCPEHKTDQLERLRALALPLDIGVILLTNGEGCTDLSCWNTHKVSVLSYSGIFSATEDSFLDLYNLFMRRHNKDS